MGFAELDSWGIPEVDNCHDACIGGTRLARAKMYQELGHFFPLSTNEEYEFCKKVYGLLSLSAEGFKLYKRVARGSSTNVRKLLEHTNSINYSDMNQELSLLGFGIVLEELKILSASPEGTAYKTIVGTLDYLARCGDVSFLDFIKVDEINLGAVESRTTFWGYNLTPDYVWGTIHRIKNTIVKTLEQRRCQDFKKLTEAGHFLAAASLFSEPKH